MSLFLVKNSRVSKWRIDDMYAGNGLIPTFLWSARRRALFVPVFQQGNGQQTKRAAERLGAGVGAVHNWVMAYREGGMAALRPRNRNASQTNKPAPRRSRNAGDGNDDAEALRRRIEELEPRNALMREVVEARRKRPGCQPAAPVEQREDTAGRPFASDVFTQLDANRHPQEDNAGKHSRNPNLLPCF